MHFPVIFSLEGFGAKGLELALERGFLVQLLLLMVLVIVNLRLVLLGEQLLAEIALEFLS